MSITLTRVIVKCPNPFCSRFGREIGAMELPTGSTVTDERYCGKCRVKHRQTFSA